MLDVLFTKLGKRKVDIACVTVESPQIAGKTAQQALTLRQGIDTPLAKKNC